MNRCFFHAVLIILLTTVFFIIPGQTRAESVMDRYFSGGHISFEMLEDEITGTSKFEAELELRFRQDGFSAFIRGSNDRPFAFHTDRFRLQKRGFNYELNDDWEISGGDYSIIIARGAALNGVEDRGIDRDAQLDGARIDGDLGFGDLTLFWGTHKSDRMDYYLSGVNSNPRLESDELWGGRLELDFDDLDIGISYIDATTSAFMGRESTVMTEFDVSWRHDNFDLYYETVFFERFQPEGVDESTDGRAHLAEIIYAERGFALAGSWIRYDRADYDYGTAPSLRRPDIDSSNARADDETGYRFDMRLNPDTWNGNSIRLLYTNLKGIHDEVREFENYFIEWSSSSRSDWLGTLSYDRIEGILRYYGAVPGTQQDIRGTVEGPIPGWGSFHLFGRYTNLKNDFGGDDELELGLDWNVTPEFTVGIFREISTRKEEPPPPGISGIPLESPGEWNSAFVSWEPNPWTEIELKIGSHRGGFQCSGGVCAQYPPFKGVQFTYYRYF